MRSTRRPSDAPFLGVGIGLRPRHYAELLGAVSPRELGVDFLEAISENYFVDGGRPPRVLAMLRERVPLALHGVSLNLGSTDPLDASYLARLDDLARRYRPSWISDHLCWTGVAGESLHDLLPLPRTEEALVHVAGRIAEAQARLGRRLAIENVSSYLTFHADDMSEPEFLVGVAERADCGILLDVNNVFVSAHNHGFDADAYLAAIPAERVFQIHLAGHSEDGGLLIDSHDHPVCEEVWALYERTVRRIGPVSTSIEWDDRIPALSQLLAEAARARAILARVMEETTHGRSAAAARRAAAPARTLDHGA